MAEAEDRIRLLQADQRKYMMEKAGTEAWITVYLSRSDGDDTLTYFSALIPPARVETALSVDSWDLSIGDGRPGVISQYSDGESIDSYHRYGNGDGIEPLVIKREFYGIRPRYIEISEEFRLFHNLYHDMQRNSYIHIDDNGDEQDAIVCEPATVRIRTSLMKLFLAAKNMHLILFIDSTRWSRHTMTELGLKEIRADDQQDRNLRLSLVAGDMTSDFGITSRNTFSRLLGKKLISAASNTSSNSENKTYPEFIIGTDDEGKPVAHTCEPGRLANSFGANPTEPHYLTPVFFRREVLNKYYANTSKYQIDDGTITCGSLWSVRIDNNHARYVVVFLGDLLVADQCRTDGNASHSGIVQT